MRKWVNFIDSSILSSTLKMVERDMKTHAICPNVEDTFEAFYKCSSDNLKVVMLGQDPYPQKGVATGVLFANRRETIQEDFSPSLRVLKTAIDQYYDDLPCGEFSPDLEYLLKQGVLLLNSALTVREGEPGSHNAIWRRFTASLVNNISRIKPETTFVLFGKTASLFSPYINYSDIIRCVHPAYCARTGEMLPNIFSEIDEKMLAKKQNLIFWK